MSTTRSLTKEEKERSVFLNKAMTLFGRLYDNAVTAEERAVYFEHIRAARPQEAQLLALICDTDVHNLTYKAVQAVPLMRACIILNNKVVTYQLLDKTELREVFNMILALSPEDMAKPFNSFLLAAVGPGIYVQWLLANHRDGLITDAKKTTAAWNEWRADIDLNPTVGDIVSLLLSLMDLNITKASQL